jgi:hypothetical protein
MRRHWEQFKLDWEAGLRRLPFFTQRTAVALLGVLVATLALLGGLASIVRSPDRQIRGAPGEIGGPATTQAQPGTVPGGVPPGAGLPATGQPGGGTPGTPGGVPVTTTPTGDGPGDGGGSGGGGPGGGVTTTAPGGSPGSTTTTTSGGGNQEPPKVTVTVTITLPLPLPLPVLGGADVSLGHALERDGGRNG